MYVEPNDDEIKACIQDSVVAVCTEEESPPFSRYTILHNYMIHIIGLLYDIAIGLLLHKRHYPDINA